MIQVGDKKYWCTKYENKPEICEKPTYYDYYYCLSCPVHPMYFKKVEEKNNDPQRKNENV